VHFTIPTNSSTLLQGHWLTLAKTYTIRLYLWQNRNLLLQNKKPILFYLLGETQLGIKHDYLVSMTGEVRSQVRGKYEHSGSY